LYALSKSIAEEAPALIAKGAFIAKEASAAKAKAREN
jgi:hypothetical protein